MSALRTKDISKAIYLSIKGKEGKELDEILQNATRFIVSHKLMKEKQKILSEVGRLEDVDEKVVRVVCTSKNKLSKKAHDKVTEYIKKKHKAEHVVLEEKIDESVIGGIKIEVGDEVLDLTLSKGLQRLEEHLLSN